MGISPQLWKSEGIYGIIILINLHCAGQSLAGKVRQQALAACMPGVLPGALQGLGAAE